jgi:hypothetical protein
MSSHFHQPGWPTTLFSSSQDEHAKALLSTGLSAAVPLWVHALYKQGGPDARAIEQAYAFGHALAEKGNCLLYGSTQEGETAERFNALAKSLAALSFLPGGVPCLLGGPFEAGAILTRYIGRETAEAYCRAVVERYSPQHSQVWASCYPIGEEQNPRSTREGEDNE